MTSPAHGQPIHRIPHCAAYTPQHLGNGHRLKSPSVPPNRLQRSPAPLLSVDNATEPLREPSHYAPQGYPDGREVLAPARHCRAASAGIARIFSVPAVHTLIARRSHRPARQTLSIARPRRLTEPHRCQNAYTPSPKCCVAALLESEPATPPCPDSHSPLPMNEAAHLIAPPGRPSLDRRTPQLPHPCPGFTRFYSMSALLVATLDINSIATLGSPLSMNALPKRGPALPNPPGAVHVRPEDEDPSPFWHHLCDTSQPEPHF